MSYKFEMEGGSYIFFVLAKSIVRYFIFALFLKFFFKNMCVYVGNVHKNTVSVGERVGILWN